jgi:hypothetical protein
LPHPPLLHAVSFKSPSTSVFTNGSELVGGHSSGHLVPTFTNYNFTGQAVALPMWLGNLPYCLPFTPIWKSALLWNGTQFLDEKLVAIDEKLDTCLNSPEAALLAMGDEVNTLKFH